MVPALEIGEVSKVFKGGVHAVTGVSLSLTSGVVGLLGPNAAGKTTLMQMITTTTSPTTGRITHEGVDLARTPTTFAGASATSRRISGRTTTSRPWSSSPTSLNDPDVLVVDEPTAGLDPEERVRFRNVLSDIGL